MTETSKKNKQKKPKQIVLTLSEPMDWGDEVIKEITLKRPKARHIEHLSQNPNLKELLGIAQKCSEFPMAFFRDLDSDDAMAVVEVVGDFLDTGRETGKKRVY